MTWWTWIVVGGWLVAGAPRGWAAPADIPKAPVIADSALSTIRRLPIQHKGRVKPFDSFARETVELLTGGPTLAGQCPVTTMAGIMTSPSEWTDARILAVPFGPLREALGLDRHATHVSLSELVETRKLMRMLPAIVEKQQRDEKLSMLETETMDLFDRFVTINDVIKQTLHLVPPAGREPEWRPIQQTPVEPSWTELLTAIRQGDAARTASAAQGLTRAVAQVNPSAYPPAWRMRLEVFYNLASPFRIARMLYVLAAVGFLIVLMPARPKARGASLTLFALATVVHASGIAMRVVLGGRPPVSNFFETMLWLPFVAVVLALVFEGLYRSSFFALSASILAALTLWLAEHVPLDSSIAPVVAVLRSNLWLTVHVLTIVASYGALALATVLAHCYGWLAVVRRDRKTLDALGLFLYRAIQVGVVLLAAGVMLGAVWANASWGRYWGWDPKETWALITLLWFLAILHGRFAGWLKNLGVALSTIAGFFLLMMTYYGVSFYLVGLHSYAGGHAKPVPALLIGYVVAELAFIAVVAMSALARRRSVRA